MSVIGPIPLDDWDLMKDLHANIKQLKHRVSYGEEGFRIGRDKQIKLYSYLLKKYKKEAA